MFAGVVALSLVALPLFDPEKTDTKPDITIESKISEQGKSNCCLGACTVNYAAELKVPFAYLVTLGAKIHDAKMASDPVALALAAKGLEVAEQAAGKQASICAADITKDAVALAIERGIPEELSAVSLIISDPATQSDLNSRAEAAGKEANDKTTKAIFGNIYVVNRSDHCVRLVIDGYNRGELHSGESTTIHVHSHRNPNHLVAYCLEDGEVVEHDVVFGHHHHLHWYINN